MTTAETSQGFAVTVWVSGRYAAFLRTVVIDHTPANEFVTAV